MKICPFSLGYHWCTELHRLNSRSRSFLFLGQAKVAGHALGAQTDRPAFSATASGAAGAAAAWLTTPLDVVKTRLQVRGANPEAFAFTGPVGCVRSIVSREGARALFSGASGRIVYATLGMAVFLPLYDALNSRLRARHVPRREHGNRNA